jgi:hypothetical protein
MSLFHTLPMQISFPVVSHIVFNISRLVMNLHSTETEMYDKGIPIYKCNALLSLIPV